MSIEDDGRAVELGFIAAVDTENFVAIGVLAFVVDTGHPWAVSGLEIWFTVVLAVNGGENLLSLSSLCSNFRASSSESHCSSRGITR